jgi:hypothetical protein
MSLSSTSSSELRRTARAVVVALIVVVLAELLLRVPLVERKLGAPDIYYHRGVHLSLDALTNLEASRGRVDVLFVGSSVVQRNIRPSEFDRVARTSGVDLVYQMHIGILSEFADDNDVPFVDLVGDSPASYSSDEMWADFTHMTPGAAARLSECLATLMLATDLL